LSDLIDRDTLLTQCQEALDFAQEQIRGLIERDPDFFPLYTVHGKWRHGGEAWTNWCEGFLPGMMWLLYQQTGDAWWRERAEHYSRLIEPRKADRNVHDLGFLFLSTYKRWYDLTGDPALHDVLIEAGRTLARRFQEKGAYLCSFIGPDSLFIDIMMNVGIIFYAALETHDGHLLDVANRHCMTTRRYLVRGDGSTAHEGRFDLETGEFLRQTTHQGVRGDSCWTRGLTWALYGFGTAYSFTRNPKYLATAEQCADFYLEHVDESGVPPWDFDLPADGEPLRDSSAAAIAASGLWNLADLTESAEKREAYRQAAIRAIATLTTDAFLGRAVPGWEGILRHGVYHYHKGLGVDESVMWGEHFFLEALLKVMNGLCEA
jgi:unsaturated chondroitin disaccharide hydrolase